MGPHPVSDRTLFSGMIVNFVTVTGLRDAWVTGNPLFLGLSVGVFLEESRIWFSRLRRSVLRCG